VPAGDFPLLTTLLSYHIVPGAALRSAELRTGQALATALRGFSLSVLSLDGRPVRLFGVGSEAVVTQPDVQVCGGGIIVHIVDTPAAGARERRARARGQ
jgi:hypothetical protein